MAKSVFSLGPSSLLAALPSVYNCIHGRIIKITWYVMCHALGSLALFIVHAGDSAATNGVTRALPSSFYYALC